MYLRILHQLLLSACLSLVLPTISRAEDIKHELANLPCTYRVYDKTFTRDSSAVFMREVDHSGVRWLCYDGKLLLQTRAASNGGNYVWSLDNIRYEFLKEGKKFAKQNGETIMLRMVVQEYTALDADNRYWLIDFREKEPLVIGPMGGGDSSDRFSVIWNDQSVIIILDDNGSPLGARGNPRVGRDNTWSTGDRKFVKNGDITVELNGHQVPILNKDGKYHEKTETVYPAYHYDYKNKKITEAVIEE